MSCIHCVQVMHIFFAKFARAAHTIYRGVSSAHGAGATDDEKVPTTCQKQPQSVATDVWKYFTKIFPNKICLKKGWELCQIILVWYQSTLFTLLFIFFFPFSGRGRGAGAKHCQKRRKDRLEMRPSDTIREEAAGRASGYEKKAEEEGKKLRTCRVFPKWVWTSGPGRP